ncbi:hypothetical protein niasHT_011081 [Heterodera trifolii]|uniref:Post-SET domain-containing protein n=1 Tax=Heterodera trifolii TaxID=157864 RepID=A0ABD2L9D0_9BILA
MSKFETQKTQRNSRFKKTVPAVCTITDGWVTESGRSRPLTTNERSQLDDYQRQSQSAAAAFSAAFRPPFPFGGPINPQLNLPQMPCFCSAASCAGGVSWVNN